MGGNTFSKYNNVYAYWCPDCDYKTNERVNLDIHLELNHKSAHSPTNEELMVIHQEALLMSCLVLFLLNPVLLNLTWLFKLFASIS